MFPALIVRFRPSGPWRFGPENGARDQVDRVFHSDSLYSALTAAMRDLGWLQHWLAVTAESPSASVRISSCYPYTRRTLMVQPPRSVWPPAQGGKVRWKSARFVPVSLIPALLRGDELNEEQWAVEPLSGCLLPVDRNTPPAPPFRILRRAAAPVDRITGAGGAAFETACLQFSGQSGVWFAAVFEDEGTRETWAPRIRSAARLLADTGVGGERSRGWGRSAPPAFEDASFPEFLTGDSTPAEGERAWWLLSLYAPSETDAVDWGRGNYGVVIRSGRVESPAVWGALKPATRMVSEGSVLLSASAPAGMARNVGTGEAPHPVYRSGIALAVPVAWHESRRLSWLAAERQPAEPEPQPESPAEVETAVEAVAEEPPAAPEREEGVRLEEEGSPQEPPAEEPPSEEPPVEEPPAEEPPPVREPEEGEEKQS